jgi:ATP-binding cassette subfamily F protein uup
MSSTHNNKPMALSVDARHSSLWPHRRGSTPVPRNGQLFCLTANNCLLLDEPSNHLDVEYISAMAEALSNWGNEDGAVVVVSHDRAFCQEIGFTHIGTVQNGSFTLEERTLREDNWNMFDSETMDNANEKVSTSSKPQVDRRLQKLAFNAPKRIAKLEELIEETECKVATLEEEMMANGSNMGKLKELMQKKDELDQKLASYMQEWEESEELLVTVAQ